MKNIESLIMKRNLIIRINLKRKSLGRVIASLGVIAMIAVSFGAVRQDADPVKPDENSRRQVMIKGQIELTEGDVSSTNIWYFFNNGERILMDAEKNQIIRAELNGTSIPSERFHFRDGRVSLTDENGTEIQVLHLLSHGLKHKFMFGVNDNTERIGEFVPSGGWTTHYSERILKRIGEFQPPNAMMGIQTEPTSPALERHLNLEAGATVMIAGLYEDLPAHNAGIQQYDILLSLDGEKPVTRSIIFQALREREPGSDIEFSVIQAGKTIDLTVTLEAFDPQRMRQATLIGEDRRIRVRSMLRPTFTAERSFQNLVIAPDSSTYMFPSSEWNFRMNEEIQVLLNQVEIRSGTEGMTNIEIIIKDEEMKKIPTPRKSEEEPRE